MSYKHLEFQKERLEDILVKKFPKLMKDFIA